MNSFSLGIRWIVSILLIPLSLPLLGQVNADFTANKVSACSPLIVKFTDLSTGPVTSWQWNFGNGNTSIQQHPGAIYVNPGTYTVTLTVSNGSASSTKTMVNYITVFTDPTANFIANTVEGCAPMTVQFTSTSIAGSAPIAAYVWNFGNGASSTFQNPTYTFTSPGTYDITLLVVDQNGCSHDIIKQDFIKILPPPVADFGAPFLSACVPPLTVPFNNTSTSSSTPLTYLWDFGNGQTSTLTNPSANYTSLGNYTVSLTVTNPQGCVNTKVKTNYIQLRDLEADFSANITSGCVPLTVTFDDNSSASPNVWAWNFGDGGSSTAQNPTHTYTTPGVYAVTLNASNTFSNCGDSETKTNYIFVFPQPFLNFSANETYTCSNPSNIQFTAQAPSANTWFWDFGDGETSNTENPSHIYNSPGVYDVSLAITATGGCNDTLIKTSYITIDPPIVDFIADTIEGCSPITTHFSNLSTSTDSIVNYQWSFGDGSFSNDMNPIHTYADTGRFSVSLIVTTLSGCVDTLTRPNYIRAGVKPNAAFSGAPQDVCITHPITFVNQTDIFTEAYWSFGDGGFSFSSNPIYSYQDTGVFTIALIVSHLGCFDTIVEQNYAQVFPPEAAYTMERDCNDPYTVRFNDTSLDPSNWQWAFGDGDTSYVRYPVHTFDTTGVYTIVLFTTDSASGCFDTHTETITITDVKADFVVSDTIACHPAEIDFIDASSFAIAWRWFLEGVDTLDVQNPSLTYSMTGKYDAGLAVTDLNGCSDTLLMTDYITIIGPEANFSALPTQGCSPLDVIFTDSSNSYLGTVNFWEWSFGNGDQSVNQHPSYRYEETGSYTVSLKVTDSNGCEDSTTKLSYVIPTYPIPSFAADTLSCTGSEIAFMNNTAGVGLEFIWDFGDGEQDTTANPIHNYDNEGIYSVSLYAVDVNGCDSTVLYSDYIVISNPIAGFVADTNFSPCPPLLVNFSDQSMNGITAWHWDFGDGSTSNLQHPSHVYLEPGNFDVTLVVTSESGCNDTLTLSDFILVLGPNGDFEFTPTNECKGSPVDFIVHPVNTVEITYDFGDGQLLTTGDTTVSHLYNILGTYHPILILDDGLGCLFSITSTDSVIIGELIPDFTSTVQYGCKSATVQFADLSFGYPNITNRLWHFGDGSTDTSQHPVHTYNTPGKYDVMLIIYNEMCVDTIVKESFIVIDPGPVAAFDMPDTSCVPYTAQFSNLTISDTIISSYAWSFGDGSIDSVAEPIHLYPLIGNYTITLIATNIKGCSDTISQNLVVHPLPIANAGMDTSVCFLDSIQLTASGGLFYNWSPTAGLSNPSIGNPLASPSATHEYIVSVTDLNGCSDIDSVIIHVLPLPVVTTSESHEICAGDSVEIWATGGLKYLWSPAEGLSCTECPNPVASPLSTTTYTVLVTNDFNCNMEGEVTVIVHSLPGGIIQEDTSICFSYSAELEAAFASSYKWSPSLGLDCNNCQQVQASPDTTTLYNLESISDKGCKSHDSILITVHPLPSIEMSTDTFVCRGSDYQLYALGGVEYEWEPATSLNCSDCNNPVATPTVNTTYHLTVYNVFGCSKTDSVKIEVKEYPTLSLSPDVTICLGETYTLESEINNANAIKWTPAIGLDNSGTESPVAGPTQTTLYSVIASSPFGCTISDSVEVRVITKAVIIGGTDTSICVDKQASMFAQILDSSITGANIVWYPVSGVDNPTGEHVITSISQTTDFIAVGYSGSCIPDTAFITVNVNPLTVTETDRYRYENSESQIGLDISANVPIVSYEWSPKELLDCSDCPNPIYITDEYDMKFFVEVTDENGCIAKDSIFIDVTGICGQDVYVPNSFTPNGDGLNDYLYVRGLTLKELKYLRIYGRWGGLIFETNNPTEGWDGRQNGKKLPPNVYAYDLEGICNNGNIVKKSGNVTILK